MVQSGYHSNQTTNTYTPLLLTVYLQNLALLLMHFLLITCFLPYPLFSSNSPSYFAC